MFLESVGKRSPFFKAESFFKFLLFFSFCTFQCPTALLAQRELILNTTGYGFDRTTDNGINTAQWEYIKKFTSLTYQGQDASVTTIRLHIQWNQYEPSLGNYQRDKIVKAVQAILNLKPGMKIALLFPFQRPGSWNDTYFSNVDVAQTRDGSYVKNDIEYTCPSIYSDYAVGRFYLFVDDVLNQLNAYYPRILYVKMGNTSAEEFAMPFLIKDGYADPGLYEAKALISWRNKFLPLRFPGQSTVRWGRGDEYQISNAPQLSNGDWNSEIGRDFHRFAGWGLLKMFKGFYDVVKRHSPNLQVLYFISDFGGQQGNTGQMHNSTLPLAFELADGLYTSEGNNRDDIWRKIMAVDVLRSTNPNKISAIEFDPHDLGQPTGQAGISRDLALEWMPRAFKHGVNYIHIAMHYYDLEIPDLAPALALCKAQYLNNNYQPPARLAPITVSTFPNVFKNQSIFDRWAQRSATEVGGDEWAKTDLKPKSLRMNDQGYWENIWNSTDYLPCTFTLTPASSNPKPNPGTMVTLSIACNGAECGEINYTWNGSGANNLKGTSITIAAPIIDGGYNYTVTTNRSGCAIKTAVASIVVNNPLPVKLISFSGVPEEKSILLNWSTSEETNSERFEVEHSPNGKSWETLGQRAAGGDVSKTISRYSFVHSNPLTGENLYRLKMIDRDGTYGYSRIISVRLETTFAKFSTYPNPVVNKMTIEAEDWITVQKVQIISVSGVTVYESGAAPKQDINLTNLSPGSYIIRLIRSGGSQESHHFVKKG